MPITNYKQTSIKGCSLYKGLNGEFPSVPCAIDVTINSPTITFASTDIAMMGTYSYPDVTRIDNCQLTVEVEAGSPDVRQLFSAELQEWRVISLSSVLNVHTGLEEIVKYTYFAKGHLTEIPSVEISPGSEGKITLTLNCLFYKKIDGDGKVIDLIDRLARTVVIGGNDFSSKINLML